MSDSINSQEIARLIDSLCDRSISEEDTARLNELLASDAAARNSYLEQVWMDAELFASFLHSEDDGLEDFRAEVTGALASVTEGSARRVASTESPCLPSVG